MTDTITVRTNNAPRNVIYGCELTAKEAAEFDYIGTPDSDDLAMHQFVRYRGTVYDLEEFTIAPRSIPGKWNGIVHDSFYSGVVLRWHGKDFEQVVMGTYWC